MYANFVYVGKGSVTLFKKCDLFRVCKGRLTESVCLAEYLFWPSKRVVLTKRDESESEARHTQSGFAAGG
jgi:hypothetical protein